MSGRRRTSAGFLRCLLLSIGLSWVVSALAGPLADHASPYLALHADDPVAWRELDADAMARARSDDRLLFVSVGYFACHWCHVMQRESFRDEKIASTLNRDFVPVKVDRELDPALDARLVAFAERLLGQAGWPLNVFVTPEGHPLFAVLYMPPDAFAATLDRMAATWRSRADALRTAAARVESGTPPPARERLDRAEVDHLVDTFVEQALIFHDDFQGGFGTVSKFPQAPALLYLLELASSTAAGRVRPVLELTLDAMADGGLFDHVGGGFFRYVVDPDFSTPHFEKMLYDNAQLARVYLRAESVFPGRGYAGVARRTLDFMRREMRAASGAMVASLSAVDGDDVEGGYYLFDDDELAAVLDEDGLRIVRAHCQVRGAARFAAGHHLRCSATLAHVARNLGVGEDEAAALFDSARVRLLEARSRRELPVDTKQLAGWNGLALSAFSEAARRFDDGGYATVARDLRDYLVRVLWRDGKLARAVHRGAAVGRASLEDYALVGRGLLDYAALTGSTEDRAIARQIVETAASLFRDGHGWQVVAEPVLAPLPAVELVADSPLPSPIAVLADAAREIADAEGRDTLRRLARETLNRAYEPLVAEAFFHATHIRALDRLAAR